MENQPDQQQKTHGKTHKDNDNQTTMQANNTELLSRKEDKSGTASSSPIL